MKECIDRNELHERAKAEREAFRQANPGNYKQIPCGYSTEMAQLVKQTQRVTQIMANDLRRGRQLREMCDATGLERRQIEDMAGIPRNTLNQIFHGRVKKAAYIAAVRRVCEAES